MKTSLTDEELINLNYRFNINHSYLFKTLGGFSAVFIDTKTRELDFTCCQEDISKLKIELKLED